MEEHGFGNDPKKIERYRAFWNREKVERPLIGFSVKSWFPLEEFKASALWQSKDYLEPEMVEPEAFMDDQVRLLREGEWIADDIFRGASPSQAVPWLCAMLGNRLRVLPGSVLAEEETLAWEELEEIGLDRDNPWFYKYMEFAETLVRTADGQFPVSHGTLVGPSDLMGAVRGHTQGILDLAENPERSHRLLERMTNIFIEITEELWRRIPLFHGGYYDAQYQLWAPGPIIRMQEDASALYSPELYREFLQPLDRRIASRFPSAFIHLHSTSMFILDAILEIDEIKCFEINNDVSGPPLEQIVPFFQTVQRAERPLLLRGSFSPDELRFLLEKLEPRGLYLYIMIESEQELKRLKPVLGL
jgi:hypothetical protein